MRLHRFFIDDSIGDSKHYTIRREDLIHQLTKVFRYKTGQEVIVFDNSGFEYRASIGVIEKHEMVLHIIEKHPGLIPPRSISLCFSLLKKDNNEFIFQKCTELGVSHFYPIVSERSEKKALVRERAERIMLEAVEQSGWSVVPTLHEPTTLEYVFENTKGMKHIMFHTDSLGGKQDQSEEVVLFIGPEGGWSPEEIDFFKSKGAHFDSLGQSVLRGETAAIVATAKYIV